MGWYVKSLGEVVTLQRGFDLPKQDRQPGDVPIVSSSGVSGTHSQARVSAPGVVTGRYGSIGQVHFIETDFWPLNTTLFVRDFKGNDPRFVAYLLETIDYASCSDKSSVPGVNRNDLHRLRVAVPDLPEQRYIAQTLGALDDKIELNRRMNRTLESIARAVFKSWFVDFDPVRRKMEGRETGLPPELSAAVPDDLEESAMGLVPKGWPVVPLSSLVEVNPKCSLARGSRVPYVEMSSLPTDAARITEWRAREFTSGSRFRNGDVLVARITPCLENGKTALVDFLDDGTTAWGSTEFLVLRPRDSVPTEYVYCLSRSEAFRDHAVGSMNGSSGRQRVPADALERLSVAGPPEELLRAFGTVSHSAVTLMADNDSENGALTELRNSLLLKLLSGELATSSVGPFSRREV